MFKKLFIYFIICSIFSCTNTTKKCENNPINPNGDSELALVMRALYINTLSLKTEIFTNTDSITDKFLNHNTIEEFKKNYENLNHAQPTDLNLKNDGIYKEFADTYIKSSKKFLSNNNQTKENYTLMVNNCIQCHEQFCLGTIKKIRKLYIK